MTLFDNYRKLIDEHISFMERMRSIHDEIFGKFANYFPDVKKELSFNEEKDSESANTQVEADDDFSADCKKDITNEYSKACACSCKSKDKGVIKVKATNDYPRPSKEEQEKRDKKLIKRIHNFLLQRVDKDLDKAVENVERGERETINYELGEAQSSKLTRHLNALVEEMNKSIETDDSSFVSKKFCLDKVKQALLLKTMFYLLGVARPTPETTLTNGECTDLEFTTIMNKIALNEDIVKAADRVRDVFERTNARVVEINSFQKSYGDTNEYRKTFEFSLGNSYFEFDFTSIAEDYTHTVKRDVYFTIDDRRYANDEVWHITGNIDFYCVLEALVHHIIDPKLW